MKRLFGAALLLALAACSDSTNTDDPSNPGPNPSSDGGGGNDGGNTDPKPGTKVRTGFVSAMQTVFEIGGTETVNVTASAGFSEFTSDGSGPTDTCKRATDGDCTIVECDTSSVDPDAGSNDGGRPKQPHAGEITVKGAGEVKMTPDRQGIYGAGSLTTRLWDKDGDVSFKAAGADVPAFEKTLKGPASIQVTAPEWPSAPGAPLEIDRAQDLEVTWSDGGSGNVQVTASSTSGSKSASVTCQFKSDAGKGTMPKAALGKLLTGENGLFMVSAATVENVEAGDWKIGLLALTLASNNAGGMASGLATFK